MISLISRLFAQKAIQEYVQRMATWVKKPRRWMELCEETDAPFRNPQKIIHQRSSLNIYLHGVSTSGYKIVLIKRISDPRRQLLSTQTNFPINTTSQQREITNELANSVAHKRTQALRDQKGLFGLYRGERETLTAKVTAIPKTLKASLRGNTPCSHLHVLGGRKI